MCVPLLHVGQFCFEKCPIGTKYHIISIFFLNFGIEMNFKNLIFVTAYIWSYSCPASHATLVLIFFIFFCYPFYTLSHFSQWGFVTVLLVHTQFNFTETMLVMQFHCDKLNSPMVELKNIIRGILKFHKLYM